MGWNAFLWYATAALGCSFGGRSADVQSVVAMRCDTCGVQPSRVDCLILTLQSNPRWRSRDDAAHELRSFDWRCHPEILIALTQAMLLDCENEVREEAAESLTKIEPVPCTPEVHAAMARVVECDRDFCTRKWAKRGLARLGRRCSAECATCDLAPTGFVSEPRLPLFGRFRLPRNAGFMVPGGHARMPIDGGESIPLNEAWPTELVVPTQEPARGLAVPSDPLESLPRIESLPDPGLPAPLIDPSTTPPPAQEASPFDPATRAQREDDDKPTASKPARVASRDRDREPERAPRRGLFGGRGLFGRGR